MADKPESTIETETNANEPSEAGSDGEPQGASDGGTQVGTDRRPQADGGGESRARSEESSGEAAHDAGGAAGHESAPGGVEETSPPDVDEMLAKSRRELANLEDRFLRQAADFQNFRKRAVEERALSIDIGRTQVALPMIDVLDDLRRSLKAVEEADPYERGSFEALREGVKLVYEKFESELARIGIKPMDAVGKPFDEERHEALMQQPAPPGTKPGTVLAEVQRGYMLNDRVLRHARVVVAT